MRALVLAVFAGLIAGCTTSPTPPAASVVGGYQPASKSDPDVAAAEKLAVDEIYKRQPQRALAETVTREQQVVAGMNYRFVIRMSGKNFYTAPNSYTIVVFKPLQGAMRITSFERLAANAN